MPVDVLNSDMVSRRLNNKSASRVASLSTDAGDDVDALTEAADYCDDDWISMSSPPPPHGDTLIIFDWDDTLCPTSHICDEARMRWDKVEQCFVGADELKVLLHDVVVDSAVVARREQEIGETREHLREHTLAVIALLKCAASFGEVCIVTLAASGWIENVIDTFMPQLRVVLEELDITIVYARGALTPKMTNKVQRKGCDLGEALKSSAMRNLLERRGNEAPSGRNAFERQESVRRWGNVLSIGDSEAEYYAIQDVVVALADSLDEECRCKALRLLQSPGVQLLTMEVELLTSWMAEFVSHNADLSVDFETLLEGT